MGNRCMLGLTALIPLAENNGVLDQKMISLVMMLKLSADLTTP